MRAMKRTVSILLSLLMIVGMATVFGVSTASAAETNTVTYTSNIGASGTIDYVPGTTETVTVNYTMTNAQNIINLEGVVTFDKTVLAVQSATSDLDGAMINTTKTDGRLPIVYSNVNGEALANDKLISVVFSVIGSGDTTVNFNVENLTATTTPGTASNNDVRLIEDGVVADNPTFTAQATAAVYPEVGPETPADFSVFLVRYQTYLAGKISLSYIFNKTPAGYDPSTLTVKFTGPERLPNNGVIEIPYTQMPANGSTKYRFEYEVYAAMFADDITCQIYQGDTLLAQDTYSVERYLVNMLQTATGAQAQLVKDLLNYGAEAQKQFNYNTDNLANRSIDYTPATVTANDITLESGVGVQPDLSSIGFSFYSDTGDYLAAPTMKIRSKVTNASLINTNVQVTFDGKTTDSAMTQVSSKYYDVTVTDIPSALLDSTATITFANGATYKTSIIAQMKNRLTADPSNKFAQAIVLYNQAANAFFGR